MSSPPIDIPGGGRIGARLSNNLARLLIVGLFALTAFRNLDQPGLYGDEAWTAYPAARLYLGRPGVAEGPLRHVQVFGRSLPFMTNDYVGPVQGYLFFVAFALFGISVSVIRATTSLLGLAGVLCFHEFARVHFGRTAANAAALLLATDLSYVLLTRHDFGAISFCLFAESGALWLLSLWIRDRKVRHLFFGALLLGLGLTQRINFLAFVAAVALALPLAYGRSIRPKRREVLWGGIGFLAGAWPVLLYNALTRGATFAHERLIASTQSRPPLPRSLSEVGRWITALPGLLEEKIVQARFLLDGSGAAPVMLGDAIRLDPPPRGSLVGVGLLLAAPVLMAAFRHEPPARRRSLVFAAAVFLLTFTFVTLIPIAMGPHHVAAIYPFPELFIGVAAARLWRARPRAPGWRGLSRAAGAIVFLSVLLSNLRLDLAFHERLARNGGKGYWTEAIDDLTGALEKDYADRTIHTLDWGIAKPVFILSRGRIECVESFWGLIVSPQPVPEIASLLRTPGQAFVLRSARYAFSDSLHAAFFRALAEESGPRRVERRFLQKHGELAFRLIESEPARKSRE